MMDFSKVKGIMIPEGIVTKVTDSVGRVLWEKQAASPYTFVDSLDIASRISFDTGVAHNSMNYWSIDFAVLASSAYGAVLHAGSSKITRFYVDNTSLQGKVDWYNQTLVSLSSGDRHKVHMVGQKVFLDGVQKVDMSTVSSFDADTNVIVGGIGATMRLWGVQHGTDANTLDLDCVPVMHNDYQMAGLYDQVSGKFFPYGSVTGG